MSIRTALENHLATMSPMLSTQYENVAFTPIAGTPYQSVNMLYAGIEDMAVTNDFKRDQGIFQVTLFYPSGVGSKACEDRAKAIRAHFTNGLKLYHLTDEVRIAKTADIKVMGNLSDRFIIVCSIYWKSYS